MDDTLMLPLRIFPKQINAVCYNRGRLALLRVGRPLRVALLQHRGLEVILDKAMWLCVDSTADDQPVMAWREFKIRGRNNLHLPVACELWLYHSCAGLIMGSALDDLEQALEKM
ncbi:hypothetical protein [Nitrosomonas sp. Nm166]|uniref:hypothetical protein n=1 Tax=Nitrosomonas sp. Nm166 TaxID=1881054 RepID=UPI000B8A377E|nr:hypothetical protein [Nitrosomonas sp. Nm166]